METPAARGPEEHGNRLRNNALNLAGNVGLALGSAAPTASPYFSTPREVFRPQVTPLPSDIESPVL